MCMVVKVSKGFLADHHLLLSKQRNDTELKVAEHSFQEAMPNSP